MYFSSEGSLRSVCVRNTTRKNRQWQKAFHKISKLLFWRMKKIYTFLVSGLCLSFFYGNICHWRFSFQQAKGSFPSKKDLGSSLAQLCCTCHCTAVRPSTLHRLQWDPSAGNCSVSLMCQWNLFLLWTGPISPGCHIFHCLVQLLV